MTRGLSRGHQKIAFKIASNTKVQHLQCNVGGFTGYLLKVLVGAEGWRLYFNVCNVLLIGTLPTKIYVFFGNVPEER